MDLVGDFDRNLSVELPSCGAHPRKSKGGGGGQVYKRNTNQQTTTKAQCGQRLRFLMAWLCLRNLQFYVCTFYALVSLRIFQNTGKSSSSLTAAG